MPTAALAVEGNSVRAAPIAAPIASRFSVFIFVLARAVFVFSVTDRSQHQPDAARFSRHLPDAAFSNGTLSLERARSLAVPKKFFCLFINGDVFKVSLLKRGTPLRSAPIPACFERAAPALSRATGTAALLRLHIAAR